MDKIMLEACVAGHRSGPAIFAIQHRTSGKRLIVATTNLAKRASSYYSELSRGRSHNAALAEDVRRDGIDTFEFILLMTVDNIRHLQPYKHLLIERDRQEGRSYHPVARHARSRVTISENIILPGTTLAQVAERLRQVRLPG